MTDEVTFIAVDMRRGPFIIWGDTASASIIVMVSMWWLGTQGGRAMEMQGGGSDWHWHRRGGAHTHIRMHTHTHTHILSHIQCQIAPFQQRHWSN